MKPNMNKNLKIGLIGIVVLAIAVIAIMSVKGGSTQNASLPEVDIEIGTSTVVTTNGDGIQVGEANPLDNSLRKDNTNLTPLIIRTEGQESIMKYNFSCVKGRTMDAQLNLGGKTEVAEVVIYDSTLSEDGQIETRTFTMPLVSASPDQRFATKDGTVEFVFNGTTGTVLEYGKAGLYKDCRMTASEIIK